MVVSSPEGLSAGLDRVGFVTFPEWILELWKESPRVLQRQTVLAASLNRNPGSSKKTKLVLGTENLGLRQAGLTWH